MKKSISILISLILLINPVVVFAEEEETTATPTPTPTETPKSTEEPTSTATPTKTPEPTSTPESTPSPSPSATPKETEEPTPTPNPTPTPEEEKPVENTLSKIEVTGGEITPKFSSTKYDYTIKVTDDKNFKITYEKSDERTDVAAPELNNSNQLKAIVNKGNKTTITVYYTDQKGKQHTNSYKITLDYEPPEKSAKLKALRVETYEFNEQFQSTTQRYSLEIPNLVDTITIVAEPEDSEAKITYNGKDSNIISGLSIGENNIKVVVKNENVSYTYYLNVTRKDEEDTEEDIKNDAEELITKVETRIKKLGDKLTDEEKEPIEKIIKDLKEALEKENKEDITKLKDELNEKFKSLPKVEEKIDTKVEEPKVNVPDANPVFNIIVVTLATLFGFALGGFGIYFFIKTSPKRMKKELMKLKENKENNKEESPIVEVKSINNDIEELEEEKPVIRDDLVKTKEFIMEDNSDNKDA